MNEKKIVWISPHLPYDKVAHAGGKIHNYYLKKLIAADKYNIRLISFFWPREKEKFDLNKVIECDLFCYYDRGIKKIIRNGLDVNYVLNPFHKYANRTVYYLKMNIISTLKKYKRQNYYPDVIILQWTDTVLFADKIKEVFPKAKIIGIEEDVTLLSSQRMIRLADTKLKKKLAEIQYKNIEREEIKSLKLCDLIILNNYKDKKILEKYGLEEKIKVWAPFFENMSGLKRSKDIKPNVLFYGSMERPENYLSAQWLLDKVKPLLEDIDITYVIAGNRPDDSLKKYECKNVLLTGYIEKVDPYFQESMCLVAPLVLGAGIKIKVLEAMSAGMPVLTNEIGIEGIPAKDEEEFLYCESPEDFANNIRMIYNKQIDTEEMSIKAKKFINKHFNFEYSSIEFVEWIDQLLVDNEKM